MGHGSKEVVVIWRGVQLKVDINVNSSIKEFALKLLDLTKVKAETMKLLVPASADHGSKLLTPFSAQHSELSMDEAAILTGKPIRMMGAFEDEVEEVSHNNLKSDLRIIGFDEEETRMKQRVSNGVSLLKLPKGNYIFCDFRTLSLPGIELNPPPSEALKRMHMLACDPGIIAIMNKHRWRVGIMTEMAPVGYVGISPKCLLGFNMNHGEEISLRLRTDDLKGFRKYESIKKTLLHELAHMVYSEHDADFLALNKQLNEEAETLDWTRSRSYALNGKRFSNIDENEFHLDTPSIQYTGQKVGGMIPSASAREASVAAAYSRVMNSSTSDRNETEVKSSNENHVEKSRQIASTKQGDGTAIVDKKDAKSDPDDAPVQHPMQIDSPKHHTSVTFDNKKILEPDPNKFPVSVAMPYEEPDPDDILLKDLQIVPVKELELDPDDSHYVGVATKVEQGYFADAGVIVDIQGFTDPDFNVLQTNGNGMLEPDADDRMRETGNPEQQRNASLAEPDPDDRMEEAQNQEYLRVYPVIEPDPDDSMGASVDGELQRIEDPAAAICRRIQKAIEMLRSEAPPVDAASSLQTLFKIIRNVTDYPNDAKFRRLRKSNPSFKKNVASYKAAMDLLVIVGFYEDIVIDEVGRSETYMVLRRDDPGLLWLAKSSLEVSIA